VHRKANGFHHEQGKRFVARADEKLTAFIELESAIRACGDCKPGPQTGSEPMEAKLAVFGNQPLRFAA
jgi:hypothetical protein